jgi:hypothetical protein
MTALDKVVCTIVKFIHNSFQVLTPDYKNLSNKHFFIIHKNIQGSQDSAFRNGTCTTYKLCGDGLLKHIRYATKEVVETTKMKALWPVPMLKIQQNPKPKFNQMCHL